MGVVKNIVRKIKEKLQIFKINSRIKSYKYIHLMFNDKFNKPFVDFLNENFDKSEHLILCKRLLEFPFPQGENVIEIKSLKNLDFTDKNVQKIICHSLFDEELIDYLYDNKNILHEKAYWGIWGGDLYNAKRDEKNDYVRKNFKGYIGDTKQNVLRETYGVSKNNHNAWYTFPISIDMLNQVIKNDCEYKRLQINNSCDESTLNMLDKLSIFKNENIKITTILSYGQMKFKDEIIKKGKEIFGDKFEYLEKFMPPEDYTQYLAQNDVLILNQDRQQGFGNIIASLYLGCKVYMNSYATSYEYLEEQGIKIYDSQKIEDNLALLLQNDKKEDNKLKVKKFFDNTGLKNAWQVIFDEK